MLAEAFPRLAVRLRSTFPDAEIQLIRKASAITVSFPNFPACHVVVDASPSHDQFQIIQSSLVIKYECLKTAPVEDFLRLISGENLGLRGATLLADPNDPSRTIQIRSTFIGQKGRTRDEGENLAIDVLSLLRFGRLLEERLLRSSINDQFSYEEYYEQYLSNSIGRNRYVNYARGIFQGSTERVFGDIAKTLRDEYNYTVEVSRPQVSTIIVPGSNLSIHMKIPPEIPMITCSASLHTCAWEPTKTFSLVADLNQKLKYGHLEVNADGCLVSFVAWKHLTNDLRNFSLDQMIASVHQAQQVLNEALPEEKSRGSETFKVKGTTLDVYRSAA